MINTIGFIKEFADKRTQRAEVILQKGKPETLDEYTYLVPFQSSEKKCRVTYLDSYYCECPDFQVRCKENGLYCKHIKAIQLFQKLKNKTEIEETLPETKEVADECPNCKSSNLIKVLRDWNTEYRLYHNVIRKHMGLNGLTPLEMAKVDLKLGKNRWLDLLKRSLEVFERTELEIQGIRSSINKSFNEKETEFIID